MNEIHVIVGAGAIGSAVARQMAAKGQRVRVLTRSGSGPDHELIDCRKTDASDEQELVAATGDAAVIYNCANPQYHQWTTDWPPIAANLLLAAEKSGAVLVMTNNLYGYGPVQGEMTEETPLHGAYPKAQVRNQMWQDTLESHNAGRIRAVDVRSSDYVGPDAESHLGERAVPKLLAGKKIQVFGDPDQPHTWTYTEDVARMLIVAGSDPRAWGKAWHTPSNPPRSQRQALTDMAVLAGVSKPKVGSIPPLMLKVVGRFNPIVRELGDVKYQFDAPFVMDSSAATATFDFEATPWDEILLETLASYGFEE
jgi:nucleoside-diphosphate-sugar epimerase